MCELVHIQLTKLKSPYKFLKKQKMVTMFLIENKKSSSRICYNAHTKSFAGHEDRYFEISKTHGNQC